MLEGLVGDTSQRAALTGDALVDLLAARVRQISHDHAELLADLVAVADACPVAEFAPMEIAAALTWTRQSATAQLDLARAIVTRHPAVHAALSAGQIDLAKAKVIADGVACLSQTAADRVVDEILLVAAGLTTGQLRARLSKLVIEVDPDVAAVKHRQRVIGRRVVLQPDPDSCASILGLDLPADRATAAAQHLSKLARAAKRAGDPRTMDQLRADTFLDLLCGNTMSGRGGGVELTCSLETLTYLASHPGDLAGYGPVIADIARQIAAQQQQAMWTYRIHHNNTSEIFHGTTRRRPATPATPDHTHTATPQSNPAPGTATPRQTGTRQGATASQQTGTRPGAATPRRPDPRPDTTTSRQPGSTPDQPPAQGAATPEARNLPPQPLHRRRPDAATARLIRSRDRTCRAPGCRAPARHTDIDHTVAHEHGGPTVAGNLGLLCRYHHRAKHEGGWQLWQIAPGHFIWQSPLDKVRYLAPDPS